MTIGIPRLDDLELMIKKSDYRYYHKSIKPNKSKKKRKNERK